MSSLEGTGLRELRTSSLVGILGAIFSLTASVLSTVSKYIVQSGLTSGLTLTIATYSLVLIGGSLVFIQAVMIRNGFDTLRPSYPEFGIGKTGGTTILATVIVSLISTIYLLETILSGIGTLTSSSLLLEVLIPVMIFSVIGYVLLGLGFYRVGRKYANGAITAGGVLLIVLLPVSVLLVFIGIYEKSTVIYDSGDIMSSASTLIPLILTFVGLGKVISQLSISQQYQTVYTQPYQQIQQYYSPPPTQPQQQLAQYPPPSPPSQQPLIPPTQYSPPQQTAPYQYGTGRIYSNGIAEFTIYSPYQVQIIKASIYGTEYTTTNVTPYQLSVGYNNVRAVFTLNQVLVPNAVYTIQLYLSNGQIVNVQVISS